jgi:hypothetical protein
MGGVKIMKYYKNTQGEVYVYETELDRQEWGSDDLVAMTKTEVEAYLNSQPTAEQLAYSARAKRDYLIESVRWRIERHRDEVALGSEPTEPLEQLLQYVQALRDVPQQTGFPLEINWPDVPLE